MAITYPLTFPSQGINSITFTMRDVVGENTSPFSLVQQTYDWDAQRWEVDMTLPIMNREEAEVFNAFMASLKGKVGSFLLGDPMGATPRGAMSGTPLVNGGGQTGQELVIDGATINITGWAKAGDYIQLGSGSTSQLYKVMQDADSDGSGNVTLDIFPSLRGSPADNSAVTTSNCVGKFKLNSNSRSWSVDESLIYNISLSCEEDLR